MNRLFAGARVWLPLYLLLTVCTGFVDVRTRAHLEHPVTKYIPEVVAGTADPPGLYRVLVPFSFDWIVRATGAAPMAVWYVTRLAWFLAAWLIWHAYLRTWFTSAGAMFGTTLVAATLPLTFTNSWAHPDHPAELALFTLGCLAAAQRRDLLFAVALGLAALNRETSAFLVLVYLVGQPFTRAHLIRSAVVAAGWAAIYIGLRTWRGFHGYDYWQFWRNVDFLGLLPAGYDPYYRAYAWFGIALFAPLVLLAWASRDRQPLFVRRLLWVVPFVAGVAVLISSIIESRIFTPVFALVVPGVMFTVLGPIDGQDCSRSTAPYFEESLR